MISSQLIPRIAIQIGATILGGLIAAGVGYWTMKRRLDEEEKIRKQRWQDRLIRLLTRLETDMVPQKDQENQNQQKAYLTTANLSADLLEEHLTESPEPIPDEVWDHFEEMRTHLARLQTRKTPSGPFIRNAIDVSDEAEAIREKFKESEYYPGVP